MLDAVRGPKMPVVRSQIEQWAETLRLLSFLGRGWYLLHCLVGVSFHWIHIGQLISCGMLCGSWFVFSFCLCFSRFCMRSDYKQNTAWYFQVNRLTKDDGGPNSLKTSKWFQCCHVRQVHHRAPKIKNDHLFSTNSEVPHIPKSILRFSQLLEIHVRVSCQTKSAWRCFRFQMVLNLINCRSLEWKLQRLMLAMKWWLTLGFSPLVYIYIYNLIE